MTATPHSRAPLGHIRPARWFAHAENAAQLPPMLEIRARMLECSHDGRAALCRMYAMQATAVRELVESGAAGEARTWLEHLEMDLAHRYLHALELWDRGELALIPACWRAVFAATRDGAIALVDSLRIGTIARLAYDMPLALASSDISGEHDDAAYRAYQDASPDRADRAANITRAVTQRYQAQPVRDAGAAEIGRQIASLRDAAWSEGRALATCSDDAERSRIFARIEMDALKQIALIARTAS